MDKLIVTVAPNGGLPTKEQNPDVPVTPDEIIEQGVACCEAGASVLHFHARDQNQKGCFDYEFTKKVLEGLRKRCGIIVQVTTGGWVDRDTRIQAVDLKPDMMSLNVGSINFRGRVYINAPPDVDHWAGKMLEYGVRPEIECYDFSHIEAGIDLVERGLVEKPALFDFVLGIKSTISYSPKHLINMIDMVPPGNLWNVVGIGRHQLNTQALAIVLGGNCRVGLEDNLYYSHRVLATNLQLVERAVRLAKELQREVATPAEARKILGIKNS